MLKALKRLFGRKEKTTEFYAAEAKGPRGRAPSATAHLFDKGGNSRTLGSGRRTPQPDKGAKPKVKKDKRPTAEFDPYNTGRFDRSASWDRISKSQR